MGSGFRLDDFNLLSRPLDNNIHLKSIKQEIRISKNTIQHIDNIILRNDERITPAMLFGQINSEGEVDLTGIVLQEEMLQRGLWHNREVSWIDRYQDMYDEYRDSLYKFNQSYQLGWWIHYYKGLQSEPLLEVDEAIQLLNHRWYSIRSDPNTTTKPYLILKTAFIDGN